MEKDVVRRNVEAVDREVCRLSCGSAAAGVETSALRASWAELVESLALGSAPELRDCPFCGRLGMSAATRCGHCWRKLTPLAGAERLAV